MDDREFKEQVRALEGSEMLTRLFEVLDSKYVDAWRRGMTTGEREEAHRMLKAVTDLRSEITFIANDAKISAFNRRLKTDNS
jgi:hypothetical protein